MPTDRVMPEGQWEFDAGVTEVFDDMLERSIPQFNTMRKLVFEMGQHFLSEDDAFVLDLGCSRGGSLADFVHAFPHVYCVGVEVSEPMHKAADARFADNPKVVIVNEDLRVSFPNCPNNLTLAVLTLQFIPIEYRARIMQKIYDWLLPGGAFILVEKLLLESALVDDLMVKSYYGLKSAQGYTEAQIERKRLSLEGVLVPMTENGNVSMLRAAGFRQVDCFWRWMQFAAWVAVKT